ncbi:Fic family protein [Mucilaginibacter paludis]|uniref:Filamentation induced by cAMP protein Fic n=1 Tax=Mucilaginibacter paludis DSM 18603 TaxID=714943 RepID=H1YFF4_9SPHI|nr:Fic family protein [Mucilaginibacter paludis]EHQ27262.1 filamentation induced by cAMP protein Fic [Mucilaginibacter paludis DSM 18603]
MKDLVKLIARYNELGIADVIDHGRFTLIAIDHHSTRLEGSTLTEVETQVLITEGRTPNGKPLEESLMVTDHHAALLFTLLNAKEKKSLTVSFLQQVNALVMKNTGKIYHTIFGVIDSATGAFRKGNVTAGVSYFPNFDKVERLTSDLLKKVNDEMRAPLTIAEQINLSFDAHFNLVSIHPYYDGNGRTSRLLMNYIQAYYHLPLAIVKSENKAAYIQALVDTRQQQNIQIFRDFMSGEYALLLELEIEKFEEMKNPSKGSGFSFLF